MDNARRHQPSRDLLDGYASGPTAPIVATAQALARAPGSRSIVLVEGISDQIALEALAIRRDRDLDAEGVLVLPVGGIHAIERYLAEFGPRGKGLRLGGLCDSGEEDFLRLSIARAGVGEPTTRTGMEQLGFYVCVADLEDELIRAVGPTNVEELLDSEGDLGSFRTMQKQPAWREQPVAAQLRRFMGAGARRKSRYARLLVESVDLAAVPRPLDGVLRQI